MTFFKAHLQFDKSQVERSREFSFFGEFVKFKSFSFECRVNRQYRYNEYLENEYGKNTIFLVKKKKKKRNSAGTTANKLPKEQSLPFVWAVTAVTNVVIVSFHYASQHKRGGPERKRRNTFEIR